MSQKLLGLKNKEGCHYCGQSGHFKRECPKLVKGARLHDQTVSTEIECNDCHVTFFFLPRDKQFYLQKGWDLNNRKRCQKCVDTNKARRLQSKIIEDSAAPSNPPTTAPNIPCNCSINGIRKPKADRATCKNETQHIYIKQCNDLFGFVDESSSEDEKTEEGM